MWWHCKEIIRLQMREMNDDLKRPTTIVEKCKLDKIFIFPPHLELLLFEKSKGQDKMAEFLWTFAVQETLKRTVKVAAQKISIAWGLEDELSKLSKWLLDAGALLRDIDMEILRNESVKRWVDGLEDIVCEAEDLLDELSYEDLRRNVETTSRVCNNFACSSVLNPLVRHDMANNMKKITKMLKEHYCNSVPLRLVGKKSMEKENEGNNLRQIRETTSILNFDVVGRETEVLDILRLVIGSSSDDYEHPLLIIPIVGMGGVGKTTLAKLVFRHELIKKHFHETIWICASERFDINEILVAILESLTDKVPTKRETLLRRLQKELLDKRCFLVLDDVWNENSKLWEELEDCLKEIVGKFGITVMVTTRLDEVANIMGTVSGYRLEKLPKDQCWSLFKRSANANGVKMTPKLEAIRIKLLQKIDGIPLVAKVLGGAVEFEGDIDRWETTLESVVREIPMKQKSFVLSILQLSVDRLPFVEKQCFTYCSNFPKDCEIVKENLIRMWIAQGFIQPQEGENTMMEDMGEVHFNFLLSRSLFQDVVKDKYGRITHFKIHDLIHDVAFAISSNHQKLVLDPTHCNGKMTRKLRTLISYNQEFHDKLADCLFLRVLEVNSLLMNSLPNLIGKLKHLRYLDISLCPRWVLPNAITTLYNLQTLKLGSIENVPRSLRNLVRLRHLDFHDDYNIRQMPSHMGELIHLQTLSGFVVGFEEGCKIEELGNLKNLKGQLRLSNLEQVKSKEEAIAAKLADKKNLRELTFEWSIDFLREGSNYNDSEVLEGLQPHKNLCSLKITNFGGKFLPTATFVENLMFLCLYGCTKCERLPVLGQLPNLKELGICFMDSVRSIGSEFYGNDSNQRDYFPKLKKFDLGWMCNLEQWELEVANNESNHFGSLQTLKLDRCGKLAKLPNGLECCKSVHDVIISSCPNLTLNVEKMHNLSVLTIDELKKLPKGLARLPNLKTMMITGCIQDYDYSPFLHLPSLTKLYLNDGLRNATQLPQQLQHLTALKILAIENFHGIEVLPEWLKKLTCLETLDLVRCKNLKQLPSRETMLCLTKLKDFKVMGCPSLLLGGQADREGAKFTDIPAYLFHVYQSRGSPLSKTSSI
ncbi:disease resistance protein RGA2-like [Benincasa hispida]|uniref:disease resistance protein RGA2-like n=1 Tax=Benincasa hispida TaxID=102211 RepID=UPI0018FFD33C|nr:disease resistance protein RGA2-like [Benincasa hispida]